MDNIMVMKVFESGQNPIENGAGNLVTQIPSGYKSVLQIESAVNKHQREVRVSKVSQAIEADDERMATSPQNVCLSKNGKEISLFRNTFGT